MYIDINTFFFIHLLAHSASHVCSASKNPLGQRRLQHRRRLGRSRLLGPNTEPELGTAQCNQHHRFAASAAVHSAKTLQLTLFQPGLPFGLFTPPGLISGTGSCTPFHHGAGITQVDLQRSARIPFAWCFTRIHSKPHNLDHCTHHSGATPSLFSL